MILFHCIIFIICIKIYMLHLCKELQIHHA